MSQGESARRPPEHEASGFFALRTPLLPFADLLALTEGAQEALADDERARLRARLRALVERPEIREAIFVASPALDALVDSWHADPDTPRAQKCERALVRYVARMAGRSTPFGLFAGVSIGTIGDTSEIALASRTVYGRTTRLDADYLAGLVEAVSAGCGRTRARDLQAELDALQGRRATPLRLQQGGGKRGPPPASLRA